MSSMEDHIITFPHSYMMTPEPSSLNTEATPFVNKSHYMQFKALEKACKQTLTQK